ncbi:unnamed protein product [Mytilus edulis]|uniref:Uncharacterized protein n=1 Tax=Mytilus edulis TaxID=6550 RepID=A0A8S3RF80_MYTED|nr:unnamed protein product [Mytilus edulis]
MRARACLVQVDDQCHDEAKPAAMKRDKNMFKGCPHLETWPNLTLCSSNLSDMFQEENKCLVLAGAFSNPEIVRQLSNEHVIDLPDLFCSHEEADTRILLHVIHSDKIFQQLNIRGRIIVKCSDTDVLVLCVHYFKVLVSTEQMWFLTGSTNSLRDCRRYIPIHELSKSLSPLLANILPAVHALTGCDTTSAIFGFGKKDCIQVDKKISEIQEKYKSFKDLEDQLNDFNGLIQSLTEENERCDKFKAAYKKQQKTIQTQAERLSKVPGMKMKDNNPSIADLSDPNRPEKLSEKFREIYDNAWTNLLDDMNEKTGDSDDICIKQIVSAQMYADGTEGHDPVLKTLKDLIQVSVTRQSVAVTKVMC